MAVACSLDFYEKGTTVKYFLRHRLLTFVPYRLGWTICWFAYRFSGWRIDVFGAEKLPKRGPVIYAANHLEFHDSIALGLHARRQLSFLAKSEYFNKGSLMGLLVTIGFLLIGQISTDRSGGKAGNALDEASEVLSHGDAVGWHFEGTRSPDGLLYDAHTSFARVAQATEAIVVPVAFVYPADKLVEVHFGDPIAYSVLKRLKPYEVAELVVTRVQEMSGQQRAGKKATVGRKIGQAILDVFKKSE